MFTISTVELSTSSSRNTSTPPQLEGRPVEMGATPYPLNFSSENMFRFISALLCLEYLIYNDVF